MEGEAGLEQPPLLFNVSLINTSIHDPLLTYFSLLPPSHPLPIQN